MDLTHPSIDFGGLARSMGVAAERAQTLDEVRAALAKAFAASGPTLIDVAIDPSFTPV
jgi:thiamine pyrophosphate-dependent acetolactate synthase large subunit-like protein